MSSTDKKDSSLYYRNGYENNEDTQVSGLLDGSQEQEASLIGNPNPNYHQLHLEPARYTYNQSVQPQESKASEEDTEAILLGMIADGKWGSNDPLEPMQSFTNNSPENTNLNLEEPASSQYSSMKMAPVSNQEATNGIAPYPSSSWNPGICEKPPPFHQENQPQFASEQQQLYPGMPSQNAQQPYGGAMPTQQAAQGMNGASMMPQFPPQIQYASPLNQQYAAMASLVAQQQAIQYAMWSQNVLFHQTFAAARVNPPVPAASVPPKEKRRKREGPSRPLSTYNVFFKRERARILKELGYIEESGKKTKKHGKIGFRQLAKTISNRWKDCPEEERSICNKVADEDADRYKRERLEFLEKRTDKGDEQEEDGQARETK